MNSTVFLSLDEPVAFIGQRGFPADFPGVSGVDVYTQAQAFALAARGLRVACYVHSWTRPKTRGPQKNIRLVSVPTIQTKHLNTSVYALFASLHASFSSAKTVWYQAAPSALFSFIPRLLGKKVVVTIHALEWKRDKWDPVAKVILRLAERVAVLCANKLVTVSEDLTIYIAHTYNKEAVVDAPEIQKRKRTPPNIITKKYGLKGDDYILYLGRFVPEKRIELLIDAYKMITPKGISLVLAGGSGFADDYEKCLRMIAVDSPHTLFTGWVFGKEKEELMSNCKLFVLPSSLEGAPIAVAEALGYDQKLLLPEFMRHSFGKQVANVRFYDDRNKKNFKIALQEILKQL